MPYQAKGDNMSSLLHKIHSIKTAQELLDFGTNLLGDKPSNQEIFGSPEYPAPIARFPSKPPSSAYTKRYFHNHIGRELNKKIALFKLEHIFHNIKLGGRTFHYYLPPSDGGLRPDLNQLS